MIQPRFTTAVGTPLDGEENLHRAGLEAHLADQYDAGIDAVLLAGTMGLMQLLRDETYLDLIREGAAMSRGKGEVFVGVGDAAFARTRDRIDAVSRFDIDGLVVLTPYLLTFAPNELVNYFHALADHATKPIFLYDLPVLTKTDLSIDTIVAAMDHPNVGGIKCSLPSGEKPVLIRDRIGDKKRIMIAQPVLIDMYLHQGFNEHLDGIYCLAPQWTRMIGGCAAQGDWDGAAAAQRKLSDILQYLRGTGRVMAAFEAIMNARGLPGRYTPRPFQPFDEDEKQRVLAQPIVQQLIKDHASVASPR